MTLASGAKTKPALDESSFQQILAAAYVVQQHNDGMRARDPAQNTSSVLTEIAEIQSLIRSGGLDLNGAARLTAERLQKIARADGANIFIVRGGLLECIAEAGTVRNGASCTADSIVANEKLKSGELYQSGDTQRDQHLNGALCRHAGAVSLIAAPIHRFDDFAGLIELRAARVNAFQETDVRSARLMSGLISGLLERNARAESRERASSLGVAVDVPSPATGAAASVTIKDYLATGRAVESTDDDQAVPQLQPPVPQIAAHAVVEKPGVSKVPANTLANESDLPAECRVCGRAFEAEDAFCGQCSMPRVAGAPSEDLQSKWASLWYMQQAHNRQSALPSPPVMPRNAEPARVSTPPFLPVEKDPAVRIWHVPEAGTRRKTENELAESSGYKPASHDNSLFFFDSTEEHGVAASSNLAAPSVAPEVGPDQDLLHTTWQTVWARMRRRHATVALTVAGFLLAFLMLAVWPSSKNSQLTWFQSMLVELGLADVPARPTVFTGNPDVRVWVDVHTALYYCQGSDLYGKTPGGHFATQHEAQQDEFEPASRVTCQ